MPVSLENPEAPLLKPNIFGFFRYLLRVSPYNCSRSNPIRFLFVIFSLLSFLAMIFRAYWMFFQISPTILSLGWAERNLYAFISMESFSCVIALYRITTVGSLEKFEQSLANLKRMRVTGYHESHDEYGKLRLKIFLLKTPIPVFFIATAIYLVVKQKIIVDTTTHSNWYYFFDAGVMALCAYVNFLFLPIHALIQNAISREFHVFNEELEGASKNKELLNPAIFQTFADRQIKMFEYTNALTTRLMPFMSSAPFLILTALANVTFIFTNLGSLIDTYYYICMIGLMICCIIISSNLMYPPALVQEAMLHTSTVLMNDQYVHHSKDPQIYTTYCSMVDRSINNRTVNLVVQIFSVNRKNIERAYFVITNIVLLMTVFYNILDRLPVVN